VSITITDNEYIQNLNNFYRSINSPTDVLSFAMQEENVEEIDYNISEFDEENLLLGDIIISIEKAIEQANEYRHSLKRELGFLVSHGMYHLLGYDHQDKESETIMFQKQERILDEIGLERENKWKIEI